MHNTKTLPALLPTALKVLDKSGLERLVVGSVAGGLSPVKSLLLLDNGCGSACHVAGGGRGAVKQAA